MNKDAKPRRETIEEIVKFCATPSVSSVIKKAYESSCALFPSRKDAETSDDFLVKTISALKSYLNDDKDDPEELDMLLSAHPREFATALCDLATTGMTPDHRAGHGWLYPNSREDNKKTVVTVRAAVGVHGLETILDRATNGQIESRTSQYITAADTCKVIIGSERKVLHEPSFEPISEKNPVVGAWAEITHKDPAKKPVIAIERNPSEVIARAVYLPPEIAVQNSAYRKALREAINNWTPFMQTEIAHVLDASMTTGIQQAGSEKQQTSNQPQAIISKPSAIITEVSDNLGVEEADEIGSHIPKRP